MSEDLEGYVTVPEAAKALGRSAEQVRRYLREGKLEGRRIGSQWFIREPAVLYGPRKDTMDARKEIEYMANAGKGVADRAALVSRVTGRREAIKARWEREGITLDAVALVNSIREDS